jgi:DNA-binding FadR family transcriptional regulator
MTRLHREPMAVLIEQIVVGEYAPGDMLPREVDLADRFEVSRGVVRESIRGLEERGLIAVKHGRGATVSEPDDWDVFDPEVLSALLAAPGGRKLLEEAVECERLVDVEAAGLAASRARKQHVAALDRALESMSATTSRSPRAEASYREAHLEFHRAIVRASGNRILARMSEPLHRALAAAGGADGDRERSIAEHERIRAAIADGDVDGARTAMAEHLAGRPRRARSR